VDPEIRKIKKRVRGFSPEITDTLCDLIAIPTVNPPGKAYQECAEYLCARLKDWGLKHRLVRIPDAKYPRYSIIGAHDSRKESLHFHGHYDVVPADSDRQFEPVLKDGCLYGRGSSDMKGGLVAMLFALLAFRDCEFGKYGNITFSLVPDEETGGSRGTRHLFEAGLISRKIKGMLMPEPTSGVVWNANKGALTSRITVKGKPAHVALECTGDNAFERMIGIARSLFELRKDVQKRKTSLAVEPPQANRSAMLIGGESGSGVNFNVVPDKAFFTVDRRLNPEENLDDARAELMEVFDEHIKKGADLAVEMLQEGESSLADPASPLALALMHSVKSITGLEPVFELCPGLCEIRFFNNKHIPAYAYGPGILEVSHGPREYVRIRDILDCTAIYALTALRFFIDQVKK